MDNLPIKPIENLCRFFIGSFVNPSGTRKSFSSLIDIADKNFTLNLFKRSPGRNQKDLISTSEPRMRKYSVLKREG